MGNSVGGGGVSCRQGVEDRCNRGDGQKLVQEAGGVEPVEALPRLGDARDEGLGVVLLEWRCGVAAAKLEVQLTASIMWCAGIAVDREVVVQRRRCLCWRRRRSGDGDDSDVVVQGGGEGEASLGWLAAESRRATGLRRRRRRGARGPNAFLLVKQGGEDVAVARLGRGVRHVEAGRCGTEAGVPERRTGCGAWLNQQFGW